MTLQNPSSKTSSEEDASMPTEYATTRDTAEFSVHIKARLKGPDLSKEVYHALISSIDADWPWSDAVYFVCGKCGGRVWINPSLGPPDLKAAAKQLDLTIKIGQFANAERCGDEVLEAYNQLTDKIYLEGD